MILVASLLALAVLAALSPLLARVLRRETGYVLAAGFLAVAALLLTEAPAVLDGRAVEASAEWLPSLGVSFALRLDGVSLVFCLVALVVGALVMAYCCRYLGEAEARGPVYPLLVVFAGSMVGLVLADDLVLLYVFWELTTLCSFALVSTAGTAAAGPGRQALLVTVAGGLALLTAVVLLVVATGTTRVSEILDDPGAVLASPLAVPVGICLALAAFTKSAQLPFHFWLPGAMVAMTPVSAYLHAATMVKAGIYLLVRVSPVYASQDWWTLLLLAVGLSTALAGAVQALREHDLKAMLAQSTVSQLGLLVAVIGVGTSTALAAALLHTMAHALFKATLFMLVGIVDKQTGSRDVRELSGLWRVMPFTAACTGVAALSMAGVPPLLGFVSKEYLFEGFLSADVLPWAGPVAAGLAVAASALTFAYAARIVYDAFGGPTLQARLRDPRPAFLAPAAIAAVAGLALGPAVALFDPVVRSAAAAALPGGDPPEVYFWHGFGIELALSAVTVTIGLVLFLARDPVDAVLHRLPDPWGHHGFDRLHAGLLALGGATRPLDEAGGRAGHLARPLAGVVVLGAAGLLAAGALGPSAPRTTDVDPGEWLLIGLLAAGVLGAALTGSTLVLVALIGVVGLFVTLWLLLAGTVDVGTTLLLVEVLTTVALVLVVHGAPSALPRSGRGRRLGAGVLALAAGAVALAATAASTGRRERSGAGTFFVENAEALTGGTNVVNTVLVDFRGVDTFLESVVVGVAALGLLALRGRAPVRHGLPDPHAHERSSVLGLEDVVLRVSLRLLVPVMLVLSLYLLWRGHDEPGGGFIAALVAGTAVVLRFLAGEPDGVRTERGRALLEPRLLAGAGTLLATAVGLAPVLTGGALLTPFDVPGLSAVGISSALLFDLGVYLLVLALVTAVVRSLTPDEADPREPDHPDHPEHPAAAGRAEPAAAGDGSAR
ncbi:hydrogen gas-evolving membrane-bound hydrogenase subunit E [Kineococcus terrestris]|uniref:hydrogen gas-evolving membrane-bound hydrogenase subunit E n=1 Tax=Kineococcus terrestris TaxID=2044856 RepID=UPI0034DB0F69